jgi:hypothetical protein
MRFVAEDVGSVSGSRAGFERRVGSRGSFRWFAGQWIGLLGWSMTMGRVSWTNAASGD